MIYRRQFRQLIVLFDQNYSNFDKIAHHLLKINVLEDSVDDGKMMF